MNKELRNAYNDLATSKKKSVRSTGHNDGVDCKVENHIDHSNHFVRIELLLLLLLFTRSVVLLRASIQFFFGSLSVVRG